MGGYSHETKRLDAERQSFIRLTVEAEQSVKRDIALRIPGWCRKWTIRVNGEVIRPQVSDGYARLGREWHGNDTIELDLGMPPFIVHADPRVRECLGKAALQRGPLVYCLEEADNGPDLHALYLSQGQEIGTQWERDLLGGVVTLTAGGLRVRTETDGPLYSETAPETSPVRMKFIPYYAWANRGTGEMRVWVNSNI